MKRLPSGVVNILATYHKAEADEIRQGLLWYRTAAEDAMRAIRPGKLPRDRVLGVVAAISPQRSWAVNLRLLGRIIQGEEDVQTQTQVLKSLAIMAGGDPLSILTGPKERAFYLCLSGDQDAVTVDGHAFSVWLGRRVTTSKARVTIPRYRLVAQDYRTAAEISGILPHQVQAITWLAWRRIHASKGRTQDPSILS